MYYVEHRDNLLDNKTQRNTVVPVENLYQKVEPYLDSYRSMFLYDESILTHIASTGSVSGYNGKVYAPQLVFDFDSTDLDQARLDTLELVRRLIEEYDVKENEVSIYFSGRKGYHIEISSDNIRGLDHQFHQNTPLFVKRMCLAIGKDLATLDRGIYNSNRLYRIAGTLHNKESTVNGKSVKLFKTNLKLDFLKEHSTEDIQKYSMTMQIPSLLYPITNTEKLSALADQVINQVEDVTRDVSLPVLNQVGIADENLAPARIKTCMWRLYQGDYTGGRNNALLRVADHEKKQGKPQEVVKATLYGVLDIMNRRDPVKAKVDPMSDQEVDTIVRQVFNTDIDFGCFDEVLNSLCSKKCYLAPKKFNESKADTVTIAEAYKRSKQFYKQYNENLVTTGFKTLDDKMPLLLSTFNLIVGTPGTGKTSVMLNLLKNASEADMPALFFNMDMSEEMLIQRAAPVFMYERGYTGQLSGTDFMEAHANGDEALMKRAEDAFAKISENVLISSQRSMTVKDIEQEIDKQEKIWGRKIKLVIVDYVQLLKSDKEGHFNDQFNAEALTTLAKTRKICVLGLSQSTESGNTPHNASKGEYNHAKGSRTWLDQASTQINCFRPFKDTHPEYDHIITARMIKNRLGDTSAISLYFHGASGIVRDLTYNEQMEFEALKQQLQAQDE